MVGLLKDATGDVQPPLMILAGLIMVGAFFNWVIGDHTALERSALAAE